MKAIVTLFISLCFCGVYETGIAQEAGAHSIRFENVSLPAAIDSLMRWYPLSIVYMDKDVEGKFVTESCANCNFEQALNSILQGTGLTWIRLGNQVVLRECEMQSVSQEGTLSGTITDSLTAERIAGANIALREFSDPVSVRCWSSTNAFGFFSLPHIPSGLYVLAVRAVGYEPTERVIEINDSASVQRDIGMTQKDIVLKEVTIEGRRTALTLAEGISHGVYLRSVPTDPNQYLLDGGRIYNPSHFGGVQSTFNSEALNDLQVVLGGLPPDYGGRIGGIVDFSLRDGNRDRYSGSIGAGSLSSDFSFEGPIANGATFLTSGRIGYPNAAMPSLQPGESTISSEFIAKLAHRLSNNQQITFSSYWGNDSYRNEVMGVDEKLNNYFSWNNGMLDLRWIGVVSPSLFLYSSIVYSRYSFDLGHVLTENSIPYSGAPLSSDYTIEDVSLRAHAEDYYDRDHTIRAGFELIHHTINAHISQFSSQTASYTLHDYSAWETSAYLQDQWKLLPHITASFGGRATSFTGDQGSFSSVDPRFSLLASLNDQTRLYSSLSTINQYLHPYNNSGVVLLYPTVFWYPSTDKIRPTTSLHGTFGIERDFFDDTYYASAEMFYRVTNNYHEFALDTTAATQDFDNAILYGTAKTYGFACVLQKRIGNFTGSVSYNLSWSFETFTEINGGNEFPPPFDRRHEIQFASRYVVDENWIFGVLCVFTLGQSSSVTSLIVRSGNPAGTNFGTGVSSNARSEPMESIDINGSRLPGFQRLELNIVRQFFLRGLPCQLSFRLLNSYGLLDPFMWKLQKSNYNALKWNATLQETGLFPLYPAIELTMRF
jgi:hypothetical protein